MKQSPLRYIINARSISPRSLPSTRLPAFPASSWIAPQGRGLGKLVGKDPLPGIRECEGEGKEPPAHLAREIAHLSRDDVRMTLHEKGGALNTGSRGLTLLLGIVLDTGVI
jgi:hypothetical protein